MMAILDISIVAWKQRQARLDGERESYDGELLEKVKRRLRDRARQLRNRGAVREPLLMIGRMASAVADPVLPRWASRLRGRSLILRAS